MARWLAPILGRAMASEERAITPSKMTRQTARSCGLRTLPTCVLLIPYAVWAVRYEAGPAA